MLKRGTTALEPHRAEEEDSPLPFASGQGDYDPLTLIELQRRLSAIALDMGKASSTMMRELGSAMKEFFGTRYVEFLMVEGDHLVYKYINDMPAALDRFVERLGAGEGVIGMTIPLFEGSFFTSLIESGLPREIMSGEDLLRSFRDFLEPKNSFNRGLRKHVAPMLMPLLGYDYIFQIPLAIEGRVIGYFSFLQKGRIRPRMRADLVLMSYQIAGFLSLRAQRERRQRLFDSLPNPTLRLAAQWSGRGSPRAVAGFRAVALNPAFISYFGIEPGRIVGADAEELGRRVGRNDALEILYSVLDTSVPRRIELDRGSRFLAAVVSRIDDGELIVTVEDITRRKEIEREIAQAASHDALTGLYNRRIFMDLLGKEFSAMAREGGSGALYFLDLNKFKEINDSLGHDAGDSLLKHVAELLEASLRASDYLARLGGDEFVLFCRKVDERSAAQVANKIAAAFASSPIELEGRTVVAQASVGIALYPRDAATPEALLSAADKAMYKSKRERLAFSMAGVPAGASMNK